MALPETLRKEWVVIVAKRSTLVVEFLTRWPSFREEVAYACLAEAVAVCDALKSSPEELLKRLRDSGVNPEKHLADAIRPGGTS